MYRAVVRTVSTKKPKLHLSRDSQQQNIKYWDVMCDVWHVAEAKNKEASIKFRVFEPENRSEELIINVGDDK